MVLDPSELYYNLTHTLERTWFIITKIFVDREHWIFKWWSYHIFWWALKIKALDIFLGLTVQSNICILFLLPEHF